MHRFNTFSRRIDATHKLFRNIFNSTDQYYCVPWSGAPPLLNFGGGGVEYLSTPLEFERIFIKLRTYVILYRLFLLGGWLPLN